MGKIRVHVLQRVLPIDLIDFVGEFYEAGGEVFVGVWSKGRGDWKGLRGVGWSWGADGAGVGIHF